MGLHCGALRRPDRAKREDGVRSPRLQIRTVDASGQPWRVAVNMKSSGRREVVFWIVDPLSTSRPTASQNRTAVSSWQAARDTDGQDQVVAGVEQIRPADRDSQYSPARTEG